MTVNGSVLFLITALVVAVQHNNLIVARGWALVLGVSRLKERLVRWRYWRTGLIGRGRRGKSDDYAITANQESETESLGE